jgi:UDP-glucose 4-epimerase
MPALLGKRVLVTGGAGFIGSHLVDRLAAAGPAGLTVVDNLFLGRLENLAAARQAFPALTFYEQDASDAATLERILRAESVDVVFDLAVVPLPTSLERPQWTVEVNVALTTVLCELQRRGLFETLIHFSSSEAYGTASYVPMDEQHPLNPSTPYAASKVAGDYVALAYAHTFGTDVAVLRPFNNYGPRQNEGSYSGVIPIVIQRALRGEPVEIFGDGEQTRDFIYVGDVAAAALRLYEEPATRGQVCNVASGEELTINRLVATILEVLGADVPVQHVAPRPGDVRRHRGDARKAAELFGFTPKVPFAEGIARTVEWYRERV